MSMKTTTFVLAGVACVAAASAVGVVRAWAVQPPPAPQPQPGEKAAAAPQAAAGGAKLSPAKALGALKLDEGTWDVEVSFWFRPGAEPVKSKAKCVAAMDLGGMYLTQRFEGTFGPEMGNRAWTSLSYTGFNSTTGEYEAVRMASTHSTMLVVRGKATSAEGEPVASELAGEYMFAGGRATQRDVMHRDGPDRCTIETYMSFGGVPEFKGAEIVMKRIGK